MSSLKVWKDLVPKGLIFLSKFLGGGGGEGEGAALQEGLMNISCQERRSFTNAFFSTLSTVNLKISANHEGICT